MPDVHASKSPSSSKMWLACPPSLRLNARLKERFGDKSSPFAEEGTKAHSLSEIKLRLATGEINKFLAKTLTEALGDIPSEMEMFTDRYVDTVLDVYYEAKQTCPDAKLFVEQRVNMERWAKDCWGTSDAVIVSDNVLVVMDLKYGKGVPVQAENNSQARLYALGALDEFGDLYGFDEIRTYIIQPRLDSVTTETLTRAELLEWGDWLRPLAELAEKGQGEFKTGEHCRFCAARAICAARASEAMSIFNHGFGEPRVIPDEDIPGILNVLDTAEAWIKDIRAYAQSQALLGQSWPGWKLVHGKRPGRKWKSEEDVVDVLARAGYTGEQYIETKLKSCAELEKVLGKSCFDALLGQLVTQGEGAITLVPDSDKRPEYSSAEAALGDLLN